MYSVLELPDFGQGFHALLKALSPLCNVCSYNNAREAEIQYTATEHERFQECCTEKF